MGNKLYFRFGTMGSSKSAQALVTKFNYEEMGMKAILLKPAADTRDGANIIKSRIGLSAEATIVYPNDDIRISTVGRYDVVICDESQFFTPEQIEQLKHIAVFGDIPVICFGLLTDFQSHLFPGSKRLVELADSMQEIKMICECGRKTSINARIINGKVATEGEQVMLGANESYQPMCYKCWRTRIMNEELEKDEM